MCGEEVQLRPAQQFIFKSHQATGIQFGHSIYSGSFSVSDSPSLPLNDFQCRWKYIYTLPLLEAKNESGNSLFSPNPPFSYLQTQISVVHSDAFSCLFTYQT